LNKEDRADLRFHLLDRDSRRTAAELLVDAAKWRTELQAIQAGLKKAEAKPQ
jgi:hypothetical protein